MEVKKTINLGSMKISFVEHVTYESLNIDSFKESFQDLKKGGYILAESFDSVTWFIDNKTDEEPLRIDFHYGVFDEINLALKGFVLMARTTGLSPTHTLKICKIVKNLNWITRGFKDSERLELYLSKINKSALFIDVNASITKFSEFYSYPQKQAFLEKLSLFQKPNPLKRELPPFQDVFQFEDIMNHYTQKNSDEVLKLKYYPIEIWWYTSNIIPLRTNEFLRIPKNCKEKKQDGTYWMTFPRSKLKSRGANQEYWFQTLQIDDKLYRFISEYIAVVEGLGIDSYYLFPQEFYKVTHRRSVNDYDRMSNRQFSLLLISFYEEVVKKKYNISKIERIKPGDTRHFAIINMFLQGFNMLTIARMAGHTRIEEPAHYYTHIPELSASLAYHMANIRPYELGMERILPGGIMGIRRKAYDRGVKYKNQDTSKLRRVDYGFCEDKKEFPINCVEDCRHCRFYAFFPSVNEREEGLHWLEDFSNDIARKMQEQIEYLKSLHVSVSKEKNTYIEDEQKWASKKLQQYMDHKVIVDLKILREYYEDGENEENE